jgi:hypothetical protein
MLAIAKIGGLFAFNSQSQGFEAVGEGAMLVCLVKGTCARYEVTVYDNASKAVHCNATISAAWSCQVQADFYVNFYDDAQQYRSVRFPDEGSVRTFVSMTMLARFHTIMCGAETPANVTVVNTSTVPGAGSWIREAGGDRARVAYQAWTVRDGAVPSRKPTSLIDAPPASANMEGTIVAAGTPASDGAVPAGIENSIVGMQLNTERFVLVPPPLNGGTAWSVVRIVLLELLLHDAEGVAAPVATPPPPPPAAASPGTAAAAAVGGAGGPALAFGANAAAKSAKSDAARFGVSVFGGSPAAAGIAARAGNNVNDLDDDDESDSEDDDDEWGSTKAAVMSRALVPVALPAAAAAVAAKAASAPLSVAPLAPATATVADVPDHEAGRYTPAYAQQQAAAVQQQQQHVYAAQQAAQQQQLAAWSPNAAGAAMSSMASPMLMSQIAQVQQSSGTLQQMVMDISRKLDRMNDAVMEQAAGGAGAGRGGRNARDVQRYGSDHVTGADLVGSVEHLVATNDELKKEVHREFFRSNR